MKAQAQSALIDRAEPGTEHDGAAAAEPARRPTGSGLPFFRVGAEGARWDDPNVPVGDAPPLPRWPLYFWIAVCLAWMVVLIAIMLFHLRSPRI